MAKGQYGLPTLYGQQHGKMTFGAVMNPFRQPPPQQGQGGNVGRMPPPQGTGAGSNFGYPHPPGTHQPEPPRSYNGALPDMQSGTPFTNGVGQGGGAWYTPTPARGITAGYAFRPRQFEADANVNTGSAFYKQNMGAYNPTDPQMQAVWGAMPVQTQLELSSWAKAGGGAYTDALLRAQMAGPTGIIIDNQYMSGDQAVEYIRAKARQYMASLAQARQQNQPQPQPTPFRIGV